MDTFKNEAHEACPSCGMTISARRFVSWRPGEIPKMAVNDVELGLHVMACG